MSVGGQGADGEAEDLLNKTYSRSDFVTFLKETYVHKN